MPKNISRIKAHHILFTVAVMGIVFYALSPLLFPNNTGLRQPELLPLYTAMLGLGQIVKGNTAITIGGGKNEDQTADDKTKIQ